MSSDGSGSFGRKALVNAAMLTTLASLASYAGGMLVSILIARSLGPFEYGQYAYAVWLCGLMVTLASSGFSNSAMRFISEYLGARRVETSLAIHQRLRRQVLAAIGAAGLLLAGSWPWVRPHGSESISTVLLLISLVGFSTKALFMFESAAAKGYGRFWVDSACIASLSTVNVLGVLLLWHFHAGLEPFLAWFASLSLAHLVLVALFVRGHPKGVDAPAPLDVELRSRVGTYLQWGLVLAVVNMLASRSFETFLLNTHATAKEVGFFAIAGMLTRSGVDLLAGGLSAVMIPVMSHALGAGGNERLRHVFVEASRYYQFVGLLLAGTVYFWAEPAVMLMYGERYRPVILPLQALVVGTCLIMTSAGLNAVLMATENQKLRVSFSVLSVGCSAVLAFTLVPRWGLNGALVSTTVSQWIVFVIEAVLIERTVGFRLPYAALARQLALAVAVVAACLLVLQFDLGLWGHAIAGAAYFVLFVGGSLLAGIWSPTELAMARGYLVRIPLLRRWA